MISLSFFAVVAVVGRISSGSSYTESDSRSSAIGIGVLAIVITTLEAVLILLLDLPFLQRAIYFLSKRFK